MININEQWQQLLTKLKNNAARNIVYVMGANDSGKTSFCRYLLDNLSQDFRTAYIDCDPGQSVIGPPTTIGMTICSQSAENDPNNYLHFIGSTTPRGHLLPTLAGIKKLTEKAVNLGAQKIILDSCGFVLEYYAREFQFQLIDLLQPDDLITIENNYEITRWINNFKPHPRIKVHYLSISPQVIQRTPAERRVYREKKFNEYLYAAESQQVLLKGIGFHGRIPHLKNPDKLRYLLIALSDNENFVITLGIVQEIDLASKTIQIYSPKFDPLKVNFIHFGSIYLNYEGKQVFP